MKVILVMVSSVNGKITNGSDPDIYKWTSKEDQNFFFSFLGKHKVLVMGRTTYEAAKPHMRFDGKKLRIVLTKNPEKYLQERIAQQLEFSDESPSQLVRRLTDEGFASLLLLGGSRINQLFIEDGLVDELFLTLEPWIFGSGIPLINEGKFTKRLSLIACKKLNSRGTLLLHYKIEN